MFLYTRDYNTKREIEMINREQLAALYRNTRELLIYTDRLGIKREHEKLLENIRKLALANELASHRVIAVAGLQGAGKTTLISTLYNIEGAVTLGRGEVFPVFITERKDCKKTTYYEISIVKNVSSYSQEKKIINPDDFVIKAKGDSECSSTLYFEIEVPYQHTKNENISFMLLPGFENEKSSWQNLVDFSLNCSDSVLFVMTESLFADISNEKLLTKIRDNFKNAIYVFSHSASYSEEKKSDLATECIAKQGLKSKNQIIFSDSYSEAEKNKEWITQLEEALDEYTNSANCGFKSRKYIEDIVSDCRTIVINIGEKLDDLEEHQAITDLVENDWLRVFDSKKEKVRKQLKREIEKAFSETAAISCKQFEENWKANERHETLMALKRKFLNTNPKDLIELRAKIEQAFNSKAFYHGQCNGIQYAFVKSISSVLGNDIIKECANKTTDIFFPVNKDALKLSGEKKVKLPLFSKKPEKELAELSASEEQKSVAINYASDIQLLMTGSSDKALTMQPTDTITAITNLGVYYYFVQKVYDLIPMFNEKELPDELKNCSISREEIEEQLASIKNTTDSVKGTFDYIYGEVLKGLTQSTSIKKGKSDSLKEITSTKKTAAAVGGALMVDFIPDQTINLIPSLAAALGMSSEAVMIAAGGIAAAVVGTAFAISITNDVNKLLVSEFYECEQGIRDIYTNYSTKLLEDFDSYFDKIREKIEDSMIRLSNKNEKVLSLLNARRTISLINTQLGDMEENCAKEYELYNDIVGR